MPKRQVALIGVGFVADLYMRSIALYDDVEVLGAYDRDKGRLTVFCNHYNVAAFQQVDALLAALPEHGLVLNLTNPGSHYEVSRHCLNAHRHVYSEKPLAMQMDQASDLAALARSKGLHLGSAPCSYLSQSAQTLAAAVRDGVAGRIRLAYAEIDDGYIRQAPYHKWKSETGVTWPAEDEFQVGCTMEHAGYYLTWLLQMFGPVRTVVAASARVTGPPGDAPDLSVGTLFFHSGMVVRLTCSIVAPHNHKIRIFGDAGVLELDACWDNLASVKFRKRFVLRRRLMESPLAWRIELAAKRPHPVPGKKGAATMNFFLGPDQILNDIASGSDPATRIGMALHVNEITLALQNAGEHGGAVAMQTTCDPIAPMPWAQKLKR